MAGHWCWVRGCPRTAAVEGGVCRRHGVVPRACARAGCGRRAQITHSLCDVHHPHPRKLWRLHNVGEDPRLEGYLRHAWRSARDRCDPVKGKGRSRGRAFTISYADVAALWAAQGGRCALTDAPMTFVTDVKPPLGLRCHIHNASLDRIDSSRGYEPGNVQLTGTYINTAKLDLAEGDFIALCARVCEHMGVGVDGPPGSGEAPGDSALAPGALQGPVAPAEL
eukprot:tig00000492_g1505.t1